MGVKRIGNMLCLHSRNEGRRESAYDVSRIVFVTKGHEVGCSLMLTNVRPDLANQGVEEDYEDVVTAIAEAWIERAAAKAAR